ncbi:MAG TPA: pentapeptide repeat-containing protein [Gemmatimonadales bacterium]|jgi:hypothetical protein|nr:pentapeptide repeat-containing protein [Gemmatimonadales bacterium]
MGNARLPVRSMLLAALLLVGLPHLPVVAQRATIGATQPVGGTKSQVPAWAFWLQQSWASAELLALLFAAYQLWARRSERRRAEAESAALALKAANYQAWAVVNSAQGKGGSGGRIDALQDLNANAISLAGVRLDGAWLEGIVLSGARLSFASLREANLKGANLQGANLEGADLTGANLTGANLSEALLKEVNLTGALLGAADMRGADLAGLRGWESMGNATYLQIDGIRRAPEGFRKTAMAHGAVEGEGRNDSLTDQSFSHLFRAV